MEREVGRWRARELERGRETWGRQEKKYRFKVGRERIQEK